MKMIGFTKKQNQIKKEILVPSQLDLSDITVLYKNKGSKQDVVDKITGRILEKGIINSNKDTLIFKDSKMNGIRERLGNLVEFSQYKE